MVLNKTFVPKNQDKKQQHLHNVKQVGIYQNSQSGVLNEGIGNRRELTQRMTATQLRLLTVLALQLITNAVQQLHIALIRILLKRVDESPRHGASRLAGDVCIGPMPIVSKYPSPSSPQLQPNTEQSKEG